MSQGHHDEKPRVKKEPVHKEPEHITVIGVTNYRNKPMKFGIKIDDRRRHVYIIGKTGGGKTTLMENMMVSDILGGNGVGVIDPHGDFAEKLLAMVPADRIDDVVYFNPADVENPIGFNPLEKVTNEHRHLVAAGLMGVFKKIWIDAWSARMEYILNNTILALLENPGSTLLDIMRMFSDAAYRKEVVSNLTDPVIKSFWVNEFAKYEQKFATEATAAIQNKVGQFVSNPLIRNIIGQSKSTINMREVMDGRKIFIANLSKGRVGEDNTALLGAMLITKMQLAAMSRVDTPEKERKDFFLYIDEFQNFSTESFANILSEARKYRLSVTLAHQYIGQLVNQGNTVVRDAIFGNVGTIITFRVGAEDAEFLEKEFTPELTADNLVSIGKHSVYIKLMIDGLVSRPFSASTLPPYPTPEITFTDVIIENNRRKFGHSKELIEKKINDSFKPPEPKPRPARQEQPLNILRNAPPGGRSGERHGGQFRHGGDSSRGHGQGGQSGERRRTDHRPQPGALKEILNRSLEQKPEPRQSDNVKEPPGAISAYEAPKQGNADQAEPGEENGLRG